MKTAATAYLNARPAVVCALVAVYGVLTVAPHDVVQSLIFWLQDLFGPRLWLTSVFAFSVMLALAIGALLVRTARRRPDRGLIAVYSFITFALLAAAYATLIMVANECVHFVQYALLAILIFPLTRNYGETVAWCLLVGAVDEGYQYFVLHAHWSVYFDFNDVVLNTLGAGLGVLAIRTALPPDALPRQPFALRRPAFIAMGTLLAGSLVLASAGYLRVMPPPDPTHGAIVLRRSGPSPSSWIPGIFGKPYHELQPIEGAAILLALLLLYTGLDVLAPRRYPSVDDESLELALNLATDRDPPQTE